MRKRSQNALAPEHKWLTKRDCRVDLQISDAGLVNFVFTKWLRPTYGGQKYALFALNSLNLPTAPVSLVPRYDRERFFLGTHGRFWV